MKDLVELGFCTKAHGIKGGFTFNLFNLVDSSLDKGSSIVVYPRNGSSSVNKDGETYKIKDITFGHKVIVYLEGVSDRNTVDAMVPFDINIDKNDLPELGDDEFYIMDMIGAEVFDHETGNKIGIVKKIYDNGMQDIFTISTYDHGNVELINIEQFIPVIDVEHKRVEVVLPEVINERN